ncbi:hypothetical protein ACKWTF_005819 [Chironomus riparius]
MNFKIYAIIYFQENDNPQVPNFQKICLENVQHNELHYKGNRFSDIIKNLSSFIFIRGGKSLNNFFQANMVLPELSGLKKYTNKELVVREINLKHTLFQQHGMMKILNQSMSLIFQNVEFLSARSNNGYLTIKEGETTRIVKKDQLIWMLENNKIHVNTEVRIHQ